MRKCKICGKLFRLKASRRYEVISYPVGLACLTQKAQTFECFDCPRCGCQNMVNIREVGTACNDEIDKEASE